MEKDKFEVWAIVELLGHQKIAGKVTEVPLFGTNMMRVDVPETKRNGSFTRFVSGSAVYAINPCSEEVAKFTAENLNVQPVEIWDVRKMIDKQLLPATASTENTLFGDE